MITASLMYYPLTRFVVVATCGVFSWIEIANCFRKYEELADKKKHDDVLSSFEPQFTYRRLSYVGMAFLVLDLAIIYFPLVNPGVVSLDVTLHQALIYGNAYVIIRALFFLFLLPVLGIELFDAAFFVYFLACVTASISVLAISPPQTMLAQISIVCSSDAFQYFFGKKFGKTKIVPSISPNKTLEGYIGGILFCDIISIFFVTEYSFEFLCFYHGVVFFGIAGDLAISSWKRYHQLKDSSSILASHGGILDRIDSHFGSWIFTIIWVTFSGWRSILENYSFTNFNGLIATTCVVWFFILLRFTLQRLNVF